MAFAHEVLLHSLYMLNCFIGPVYVTKSFYTTKCSTKSFYSKTRARAPLDSTVTVNLLAFDSKFIGVRYEFIRINPSVCHFQVEEERRSSETLFHSEVELISGSHPQSSVERQVFMKFSGARRKPVFFFRCFFFVFSTANIATLLFEGGTFIRKTL